MKILMILTSHDMLGNTGKKTGFWLEEFAAPFYVFQAAGANITLASPMGGQPPIDPSSDNEASATEATKRFKADAVAQASLAHTRLLSEMQVNDFDAVFYPGGHGPLWDLSDNPDSIKFAEGMLAADKPVVAVCHAPGVLRRVKAANGELAVKGRAVTGFTNTEEAAAGLTDVVPFLVEDMLRAAGGTYSKAADWQPHVVTSGRLITGQNPASSAPAAEALLDMLGHSTEH